MKCRALLDQTAGGGCLHIAILQSLAILLNLSEYPGIRGGCATDHYRVTFSRGYHGARVFRAADVSISDHRNLDCIFNRGNPLPACVAAVALLASAGMERNCAQAAVFGNFRQLDADNLFVIPAGAELDGKWNFYRRTHRFENSSNTRQVAQQAGSAITFHDLFRRTAQV